MSAADLRVGAIRLRVGGLDEGAARDLADLVARRLAALAPGVARPVHVDRLHVEVAPQPGEAGAALAERIVDEVLSTIDRLAGGGGGAS